MCIRDRDGAQHVKVGGFQAVQDHLRAFAGLGQLAQQAADGGAAIGHSDHIEASIGAQLLVHLLVDIAQAAVMDQAHPAPKYPAPLRAHLQLPLSVFVRRKAQTGTCLLYTSLFSQSCILHTANIVGMMIINLLIHVTGKKLDQKI